MKKKDVVMRIRQWDEREPSHDTRPGTTWGAIALSLLLFSGCASTPNVPPILQVPAGQKVFLHAYAQGVQIYVCESSSSDSSNWVWRLKAPEAMLYDGKGNLVGWHYSGPTWEDDRKRSKVVGEVLQHSAAPRTNAIPWLLVQAKSTEGPGRFQRVTYIQRVNTKGGRAPATAADETHRGKEARVPYTAEYYFYRAKN